MTDAPLTFRAPAWLVLALLGADCIAAWRKYHSRGWWRWYDYWAN